MRNGTLVFMVHGKCGQEDVGAMHDKLWDEQHVEVFPSNVSYVEHQFFFFGRGHCAQGPSWYKGFLSSRGKLQWRRRSATWCELATMEGVGEQEEPRRVDQYG